MSLFFSETSLAAEQVYALVPQEKDSTGVTFSIPYSLGTHDGVAKKISGSVTLDLSQPKKVLGSFKVQIHDLQTGNTNQDCHLREALGIDYSKSNYPKEHVCSSDDKLPESGVDSVVYPNIEFKIKSFELKDKKVVAVTGAWEIHGVSQSTTIPIELIPEKTGFRLVGTTQISLASHQIEVKPAKIIFAKITVDDIVTVKFDLRFQPIRN